MIPFKKTTVLLLMVLAMAVSLAYPAVSEQTFKVGVATAAPYAMKNSDGQWEGISVELWQAVAAMLGVKYEYQAYDDHAQLVKDMAAGRIWRSTIRLP